MTVSVPIWAVVPVKALAHAKIRLGYALNERGRRGLVLAMLEDVLNVLLAAPGLAGVIVATSDPHVTKAARARGARVLDDSDVEGLNEAVSLAADRLQAMGCGMLAIHGDVPLTTVEEIGALLGYGLAAPHFGIVRSHDGAGSNAILCVSAALVPPQFGPDSFARHVAVAAALGIAASVLPCPGIAQDIDVPADLERLASDGRSTCAGAFLAAKRAEERAVYA